ncbi:MAG: phosphonate ABC transporter, permease protein PhnE, partial [Gammaproteobacteria bacterium]|nr:phosphonate ABC transporter, permease protein PhnE [Gammaproteobacteria bacterium]
MNTSSQADRYWHRERFIINPVLRWGLWSGLLVYLALAIGSMDINWSRVMEGLPRGLSFISSFFPPDFTSRSDAILDGILESLWMTVT